jgi:hypothetical protein
MKKRKKNLKETILKIGKINLIFTTKDIKNLRLKIVKNWFF